MSSNESELRSGTEQHSPAPGRRVSRADSCSSSGLCACDDDDEEDGGGGGEATEEGGDAAVPSGSCGLSPGNVSDRGRCHTHARAPTQTGNSITRVDVVENK